MCAFYKHSFFTPHQSGFTPGDSAINQLLSLTNEFGKALDEGKEIHVVFCAISKAFDKSPFDINSVVFHFDDSNYGRRSRPYCF
jgi:hypothetical protein